MAKLSLEKGGEWGFGLNKTKSGSITTKPASISSGSETKASKTPTVFPTPTFSPRKSSRISKPPSNNSVRSPRT